MIDYTNNTYGDVTVIKNIKDKTFPSGQKTGIYKLLCSCGVKFERELRAFRSGRQKGDYPFTASSLYFLCGV